MRKAIENSMSSFEEDLDCWRIYSAELKLRKILEESVSPIQKVIFGYELGVVHWKCAGDGSLARGCFEAVVDNASHVKDWPTEIDRLDAYAMENLMQLSLSYEEYFSWADRLRAIAPGEEVLLQQMPAIRSMQEQGIPWRSCMSGRVMTYVSHDPSRDPGIYGSAACILSLILGNRRLLRVSVGEWREVLKTYIGVGIRSVVKARECMRPFDPSEMTGVIQRGEKYVNEYCSENPGDEGVEVALQHLRNVVFDVEEDCDTSEIPFSRHSFNLQSAGALTLPSFWGWLIVVGAVLGVFAVPLSKGESIQSGSMVAGTLLMVLCGIPAVRSLLGGPSWQGNRDLLDVIRPAMGFGAEFQLTRVLYGSPSTSLTLEFSLKGGRRTKGLEEWARLALPYIVLKTVPSAFARVKGGRCTPTGVHPMSVIGETGAWIVNMPTMLCSLNGNSGVVLGFQLSGGVEVCSPRSGWKGDVLIVKFVPLSHEVPLDIRRQGRESLIALGYAFESWKSKTISC